MEPNETIRDAGPRDPASISPSAYALLMMKSHTSIPYAREAAALLASQTATTSPNPAAPPATTLAAEPNRTAPSPAAPTATPPTTLAAEPNAPPATTLAAEPNAPPAAPAPNASPPDLAGVPNIDPVDYWTRVMHFESRYWSINQLLADLTATNILEISSGFSFRGLDLSNKQPVFYIDTDLPNIITGKQRFIDAFATKHPGAPASLPPNQPANQHPNQPANRETPGHPSPSAGPTSSGPSGTAAPAGPTSSGPSGTAAPAGPTSSGPSGAGQPANRETPGHYELCPLNALDPAAFDEIIKKFPPGPLTIVNEGLLVYLDLAEKQQLAANIRKALLARGGHWITADIYIRKTEKDKNEAWRQWSKEHGLEEKKFESFQQAETFFQNEGFTKEKEATQDYSRLTSFPQFLKATGPQGLDEFRRPGRTRIRSTWRLTPRA